MPNTKMYKIQKYTWYLVLSFLYTIFAALKNKINIYASSCTYYFLVALVPLILLIGIWTANFLEASIFNETLNNIAIYRQIKDVALSFGADVSASALGIFGTLYGLWSVSLLMRCIRKAFNTIFYAKVRQKRIISWFASYIIIPLLITAALVVVSLSYAIFNIASWFFVSFLNILDASTITSLSNDIVCIVIIVSSIYAGFMLLTPNKPKRKFALFGALLFALYFFILQKIMLFVMSNLLINYALYGALGTLLLVLLWVFLIFYGLFIIAQYVSILNNFAKYNYSYFLYINLLDKPNMIENFLINKLRFADDIFAKILYKDEFYALPDNIIAVIVKKGSVVMSDGEKSVLICEGSKKIAIGSKFDGCTIKANDFSIFITVSEKSVSELFRDYPDVWEYINLDEVFIR